jgi:hypothetical protein
LLKIISGRFLFIVIFDVSSHGILPGNQTLTEIVYNLFLQAWVMPTTGTSQLWKSLRRRRTPR